MPNLKDIITQKIEERKKYIARKMRPQWNGYAWVREYTPTINPEMFASLQKFDADQQTDAHTLLKRFYRINYGLQPQREKLYRIPHLVGSSIIAFPYYASFFITIERGESDDLHFAHLRYQSSNIKKSYWIASAKIEMLWDQSIKGRKQMRDIVTRIVNTRKFKISLHAETQTIIK